MTKGRKAFYRERERIKRIKDAMLSVVEEMDFPVLLNDTQIASLCGEDQEFPMIIPFLAHTQGKPSYGLGSFGYDVRLGHRFLVKKKTAKGAVLDPLDTEANEGVWEKIEADGFIIMEPGEVVLAETMEWFNMPDNVAGVCLGKSTYARLGLLVNATPLEPQWRGRLTLEQKNLNPDTSNKLYIERGIAQILFFKGIRPKRGYGEREAGGIYQMQTGVSLPQ